MIKIGKVYTKSISILVCIMMMSGCGVTPKKPLDSVDRDNRYIDFIEKTRLESYYKLTGFDLCYDDKSIFKTESFEKTPDFGVSQWQPKPMDYKGKLVKKWKISSNSLKAISVNNAQSMPDGWRIDAYAEKSVITDTIIDPSNGKPIRPIKFSKDYISTWLFADKYIFAEDDECCGAMHKVSLVNPSNWKKFWVNGWLGMDHHLMIVDDCLIDGNFGPMFDIQRFDHRTGNVLWRLKLPDIKKTIKPRFYLDNKALFQHRTCFTDDGKLLYVVNDYIFDVFSKEQTKRIGSQSRLVLYRINPKDGSSTYKDLYTFTNRTDDDCSYEYQIHFYNGYLWVIAKDGTLLKINTSTMDIDEIFDIGWFNTDDVYLIDGYLINVERGIQSEKLKSMMINLNDPKRIVQIENDFDIANDQLNRFDTKYSGQLIVYSKDRIRQITDDKMSTGWYIDTKELGSNPQKAKIVMQDWRGVLVVTDNELICFGKP